MQIQIWIVIILLVLGGIILSKCASFSVKALSEIGDKLRLSTFLISFVIMSLATSLPELFVGVVSSLKNESHFALATVMGSNIVNLTFITGVIAILAKLLGVRKVFERKHGYYALATTLFFFLFLLDGQISRLEGVVLIIVYFIYVGYILTLGKSAKNRFEFLSGVLKQSFLSSRGIKLDYDLFKHVVVLLLSVAGLIVGAELVFRSSVYIASYFNFPNVIMAFLFVSLSTSLPELAFEIKAVRDGKRGMVLGDLLGSISANSGLIVGICALISPINILTSLASFNSSITYLVAAAFLFIFFVRTEKNIDWKEGVVLITVYLTYVLVEYLLRV